MSRKYKFHEKDGAYFISFATVFWIDFFTRLEYFDIMIAPCWRERLARAHTIKYEQKNKFHEKDGAYFISFATVF